MHRLKKPNTKTRLEKTIFSPSLKVPVFRSAFLSVSPADRASGEFSGIKQQNYVFLTDSFSKAFLFYRFHGKNDI
jgi:hypothetical protein